MRDSSPLIQYWALYSSDPFTEHGTPRVKEATVRIRQREQPILHKGNLQPT
jgi:hypothetical protein